MEKKYKKGITAFLPVFNEEKRIEACLITFQWCDEVIVLDKYSIDNTIKIASKFKNVRILTQANTESYNPLEFEIFMNECETEWCMIITASDIIHKDLVVPIQNIIHKNDCSFDSIAIPYRPYMMGQYNKYSPWYAEYSNKIVKTDSIQINLNRVHSVFEPSSVSTYKIRIDDKNVAFYHLTHEDADTLLTRHSRYWKGERNSDVKLSSDLKYILKKTIQLIFLKKTFFKGQAAIALAFSFLSYHMMSYVFKWDKKYGNGDKIYNDIRSGILKSWQTP